MEERKKIEFIESYIKVGESDYQWNDNHGELIRCKDCRYRNKTGCPLEETPYLIPCDDWFCADGEKRTD